MDGSGQYHVASKRPRRCVQSKLSFSMDHKAEETRSAAEQAPVAAADDRERKLEGREKEGKRKRNKKTQPQDGDHEESADNEKEAKELSGRRRKSKQTGDETPRKNRTPLKIGLTESSSKRRFLNGKSDIVKDCNDESPPICDLWSEAKKAAEENLRLSAGKQTHPFFSICRATKRSSETIPAEKSENRSCLSLEGDYCIALPPVHVFENVKDDVAEPNWKNWKFLETSLPKLDGYRSMEIQSIFEVSTKSLILEAACGKEAKFNHLLADEKMNGTSNATSSNKFSNELLSKEQLSSHFEMVHVGCNFSLSSNHCSSADDQDQVKIHKGRLASYYQRGICYPDCSLWTEKYRPESSLEVCGNTESVNLLSDWLKSWQERGVLEITNGNSFEDSEDSSYDNESGIDELDGGDSVKNLLLITGPVGSGKSAAIYACAREQGFKVIEVNASCLRNGAYMRQTFGEGVDSLGLTHWLAEDQTHQQSTDVQEFQSAMPVITENGVEAVSIKKASRLYDVENATEKSSHFHIANKTLFLFEEVDVVFDEDHGFISTIFKLAETTKRPIILTSNTKRPVLPHLLDRLVLDFKAPSYRELLYHTSMVCAFEKVCVSCSLLEHIIKAYVGDIRRIFMLLQFWCQGFRDITEKTIQCTKSPVPFDIGAVHLAIPKVIPWDFRCELSEKVEEEISKTVFAVEENSFVKEVLQDNVNSREMIDTLEKVNSTTALRSRKKGKLRKHSTIDHTEFSDHMNHFEDILYDSDSPSTCFQRVVKQKRCVVLSSQSDDGISSDELKPKDVSANQRLSTEELKPEDTSAQVNGYNLLDIATSPTSQSQELRGPFQLEMDESRTSLAVQNSFDISEVASTSYACDNSRIQDVSCMSESSLISGTETNLNIEFLSQEVSHNSGFTSLYDLNISPHIQPVVDLNNEVGDSTELSKRLKSHVGTADVPLLQMNQEIGCFQNEEEHELNQCQLVNERSRPDFNAQSMPRDSTACSQEGASVPDTWRRLRSCHENLKLLSSNSKDVSLLASLTSGLVDLITETDIMFSSCNPIICDSFEPTSTPCVEPDSFSWYDDQVEMGSTFAQHGLCFYTMKFSAVGSCLNFNNTSDLAQEMLASSTCSTALGKRLTQKSITDQNSCFKDSDVKAPPSLMPIGRESAADFYSAILPIVPTRLSMVLKGVAFHEYLSVVGQISRFECSRLAESFVDKKKRRPRTRMHYFSSELSSEQAELLAQRSCFMGGSSLGNNTVL